MESLRDKVWGVEKELQATHRRVDWDKRDHQIVEHKINVRSLNIVDLPQHLQKWLL